MRHHAIMPSARLCMPDADGSWLGLFKAAAPKTTRSPCAGRGRLSQGRDGPNDPSASAFTCLASHARRLADPQTQAWTCRP
eukprot:7833212-Alexandrium_andersonii.AAC.1